MKAFVEFVVKALVDHPEEVDIRQVDGERTVVFELRLNQTDIGKVIGKSGRTITAIRSLLTSAGENCLLTSKSRKFMVFFFLPAVVAGAVALTSGAAVLHKV